MDTDIGKLVKNQPKGYIQTISTRLGVTRKTVYDTIDRGKIDHPIIKEMIKLAEEYKIEITELKERIEKIAS